MSTNDEEDEMDAVAGLFPEEPRPPTPPPTISSYVRTKNSEALTPEDSWKELKIKLVGSHPLWGHHLWNAARAFATFLDDHVELYKGKNVLELGAGGGLPGLVTVLNGAKKTLLTDYPDCDLLENLEDNVATNVPADLKAGAQVLGYIWGSDVSPLLEAIQEEGKATSGFIDLVILSDLVFNHSQHDALIKTCDLVTNREVRDSEASPTILVFYTHHRPYLAARDLEFFDKARIAGWICNEIVTERHPPMFPDDPGEEEVRATVHGWSMRRTTRRRAGECI